MYHLTNRGISYDHPLSLSHPLSFPPSLPPSLSPPSLLPSLPAMLQIRFTDMVGTRCV